MALINFKLNEFEGPLDLLLHLITKHKLDICDIEISVLLEQYLAYIDGLSENDFEGAGEFLEMAARLILIKTLSLLPKPEEAVEMKKELEGKLIEYSLCKLAAGVLADRYIGNLIFVRNPAPVEVDNTYCNIHEPEDLPAAFMSMSLKARRSEPVNRNIFKPLVSKRIVSVTSKIIFVLKRVYTQGKCEMKDIYSGMTDKSEKVATFLAILELTKSGRIMLNDDNTEVVLNRERRKAN